MPQTALLIGPPACLTQLERQLDLLADRPVSLGWVLVNDDPAPADRTVLGHIDELESIVATRQPSIALVSMPAVMGDAIVRVRTRLRRLGIPDRFMPTLDDQVAGIGPRTYLDIDHAALIDRPSRPLDETLARNLMRDRRVLVTGAGGSIGSELARLIAACEPETLLLMDRAENALFEIDRQIARRAPHIDRKALLHDVVDARGTLELCRRYQPELIFHAAAHKHVPMMEDHPTAALDNNVFGTRSVLDAAVAIGADRFVMISTDKAVNPTSIMGATKRLAELYVQHVNRRSTTACSMVRFGNVLASSGSVLETWARQIADGGPITITDPEMTRYFMTINEAAALVIESAALVDPAVPSGEVFVLDMGEPIRILDMAERLVRMHGLVPMVPSAAPQPGAVGTMPIVFTGARPGEKVHEELALDVECMKPTRHDAINIWTLPVPDDAFIARMLGALAPESRTTDATAMAALIRDLVPESARHAAA